MKQSIFVILCLLAQLFSAQNSLSVLTPAQKVALNKFLSSNPSIGFESEGYFNGNGNEKVAKDYFGYDFTPYYNYNDFNADGRKDFAMLLSKSRSKQVLVIFNNIDGKSYRLAYKKELDDNQSGLFIAVQDGVKTNYITVF